MVNNPTYQTTLTLNEEDNQMRMNLTSRGISVIDIWRRGALELTRELENEEKDDGE